MIDGDHKKDWISEENAFCAIILLILLALTIFLFWSRKKQSTRHSSIDNQLTKYKSLGSSMKQSNIL
jgi:hypothetical protein